MTFSTDAWRRDQEAWLFGLGGMLWARISANAFGQPICVWNALSVLLLCHFAQSEPIPWDKEVGLSRSSPWGEMAQRRTKCWEFLLLRATLQWIYHVLSSVCFYACFCWSPHKARSNTKICFTSKHWVVCSQVPASCWRLYFISIYFICIVYRSKSARMHSCRTHHSWRVWRKGFVEI